jgi:hypothetical protein
LRAVGKGFHLVEFIFDQAMGAIFFGLPAADKLAAVIGLETTSFLWGSCLFGLKLTVGHIKLMCPLFFRAEGTVYFPPSLFFKFLLPQSKILIFPFFPKIFMSAVGIPCLFRFRKEIKERSSQKKI